MVNDCRTILLDDQPAKTDDFESHAHVADALFRLIQSSERGGPIALTGSWGSGKSTVIKLLTRQLELPQAKKALDTQVFTFDAWAHQGDPLRRCFIEQFVKFSKQAGWTDKEDKWKKDLQQLTRHAKQHM